MSRYGGWDDDDSSQLADYIYQMTAAKVQDISAIQRLLENTMGDTHRGKVVLLLEEA